jgi:hypothetical protein
MKSESNLGGDLEFGTGSSGDDTTNIFRKNLSAPFDVEVSMRDLSPIEFDMFAGSCPNGPSSLLQKSASMPTPHETRMANNASARKYRAKKRKEIEVLKEKCNSYESCNIELQILLQKSMRKIDELEKEMRKLRESSEE